MFRRRAFDSLESAAGHPLSVRELWLMKRGVRFEAFSQLLPQLKRVRRICLGWQAWTSLPAELAGLTSLKSLEVLNIPLRTFPMELVSCRSLTELVIRGTDITELPAAAGEFPRLRRLDFSNNPIREIPPELGKLSTLRELALGDNRLTMLPESLSQLRRLRRLILPDNCFSTQQATRIRQWFRAGVVAIPQFRA